MSRRSLLLSATFLSALLAGPAIADEAPIIWQGSAWTTSGYYAVQPIAYRAPAQLANVAYTTVAPVAYSQLAYQPAYAATMAPAYVYTTGGTVQRQAIDSRFAQASLLENVAGGARYYTLNINGRHMPFTGHTNSSLQVVNVVNLPFEDAVLFAANTGSSLCPYNYYVMSIREDGTTMAPTPIGSCATHHRLTASGDRLLVSFFQPSGGREVWQYRNTRINQL